MDAYFIVCVESFVKYKVFLSMIRDKYKNVQTMMSLEELRTELSELKANHVTVVFLDEAMAKELRKDVKDIFKLDNYICIILYERFNDHDRIDNYVYDYLECSHSPSINRFLSRLEKDIQCRIQLMLITTETREFYKIGQKLTAEKDINILMELIIDASMKITNADAGTLYVIVDDNNDGNSSFGYYKKNDRDKYLKFVISKNKSIALKLQSTVSPIMKDTIVGNAVINGIPIRIEDAYNISKNASYAFSPKFDKITGYRTKSILTVPMKDHQNRVLGVVQLINKQENGQVIPFNFKDEMTIYSLAGQAAVALENSILYGEMGKLLENYRQIMEEEITKRKQTDEEINKLLSAVEHCPSIVIITNAHGEIQYVNPKLTEVMGYEYKEVVGKTPRIFKSGNHSKSFYRDFWNTILSGEEWRGEIQNRKKNGEIYWEWESVSSLKDNKGQIKYFIVVKEDITEKKMISMQLENKNIELQKTLEELKATQSQLIQKERMAGIGHLAAGIAHEINNPLGFIMSNNQTMKKYFMKLEDQCIMYKALLHQLLETELKEDETITQKVQALDKRSNIEYLAKDFLEMVEDTSNGLERIKEIVSALRTFSHIDQYSELEEYDLNKGIQRCLLMIQSELRKVRKIREELKDIPLFRAKGQEINLALINMILNAIYAIEEKGNVEDSVLWIRTYYKQEYIYCEIEDNGIGIKEEHLSYIFNPFFTTKPVGAGKGLGLSIAYDILVKAHKGEILVESKPGLGTKFTIKFPRKQ
ncbi:MAG: PAS domain S-box protein [Bacillota bacterium]